MSTTGSQRKIRRGSKKPAKRPSDTPAEAPAVMVNKLVITNRNPTKFSTKLCQQLRKIFDPECMTHLKEKHPRFKDCLAMADHYLLSHIIIVSDSTIQMGVRPHGPTFTFKILEYDDEFKNYHSDIFRAPPFITYGGKSALMPVFEKLGRNAPGFKRTLHFKFDGEKVYVRHFNLKIKDTEDNFVLGLKEIGPRLTLQLIKTEDGFYPEMKVGKPKNK